VFIIIELHMNIAYGWRSDKLSESTVYHDEGLSLMILVVIVACC
jgi:hypothetical protein